VKYCRDLGTQTQGNQSLYLIRPDKTTYHQSNFFKSAIWKLNAFDSFMFQINKALWKYLQVINFDCWHSKHNNTIILPYTDQDIIDSLKPFYRSWRSMWCKCPFWNWEYQNNRLTSCGKLGGNLIKVFLTLILRHYKLGNLSQVPFQASLIFAGVLIH